MIDLKKLTKIYKKDKGVPVTALKSVSLKINQGELVAILGPSGSGKSTLMNIMGLLDKPDSGEYLLSGQDMLSANDGTLAQVRNKQLGFVFQSYHLLPKTTAIENVQLPLLYANATDYKERSINVLKDVGLEERMSHYANELSGGQQQRVAIARAIVNDPEIILADEPTGNLDSASQDEIINIFQMLNDKGTTVVMITHDIEVAKSANRIINIKDGEIASDELNTNIKG